MTRLKFITGFTTDIKQTAAIIKQNVWLLNEPILPQKLFFFWSETSKTNHKLWTNRNAAISYKCEPVAKCLKCDRMTFHGVGEGCIHNSKDQL